MNFLGLGFSFGAKDTGLGSFLEGIDTQFQKVTDTLRGLYDVADKAPQVGGGAAQLPEAGDALAGAAEAAAGLGAAGDAAEAAEGVAGAAKAATAAGDAMSMLGGAGKAGGEMLSSGAFLAVGALGKVAGAAGIAGMAIGPVVSGFGDAVNAVQGFGESVAMALPNMVRRGMDGIQRMNQGINLTNSLEAEAQGLSVSARQLGANMGYTGEQLNSFTGRATSMAMALNMGSDSTAKAIRAWDEAGDELRSLGFEGARDVARFTEAFGVDADTLRNTSMQMTREFGLTREQVHELVSSQVAMGQATGDVAGALNQLPQIMEHTRSQAALMGEELDGAELAHHAQGTAALAAGFFQLSQDSDQAREAAVSLAGAMLESRREFQNMFAGTADELPQFAQEIAIATGDVDSAFEAMSQGPDEFMSGMAGLVQQTRENNGDVGRLMEFMRARFSAAVGPEQADQMVNFFRNATPEILEMMKATAHATRNLGEMGREAHRTGRTMQENFDRAIEGASTALRSVTRQETAQFVRETGREMRRLGGAFREIGEQEGPMGGIVRMMSRTAQLGQLGLVPERFRTTAVMANQIHENMQPLINSLTSFGGMIDFAASQAVLFGTRVAQNMEAAREELGDTASEAAVLRSAFDTTANEFAVEWINAIGTFERYFTMFVEGFAEIDWAGLFTPSDEDTARGADGAMGAFQKVIHKIRKVDWSGIWESLSVGATRLWKFLKPYMEDVWNDFQEWIVPELEGIWKDVADAWNGWWEANWMGVAMGLVTVLTVLFTVAIIGAFVAALALLAVVAVASFILAFMLPFLMVAALMYGAWELWGEDIMALTEDLGAWFGETWSDIGAWFEETWNDLGTWWDEEFIGGIKSAWNDLWMGAQNKVNQAVQWFQQTFPRISKAMGRVAEAGRRAFAAVWSWFETRVGEVTQSFTVGWDAASAAFGSVMENMKQVVEPIMTWLSTTWASITESVSGFWDAMSANVTAQLERISEMLSPVRDAMDTVSEYFTDAWERVERLVTRVGDKLKEMFDSIGEAGLNNFVRIFEIVKSLFQRSMNTIIGRDVDKSTEEFQRLEEQGQVALHGLFGTAEEVFGNSMNSVLDEGFGSEVRAVAEVATDPQHAASREAAMSEGGGILEAVHYPDWYVNDFKRLYDTRSGELIRAIRETAARGEDTQRRGRARPRGQGGAAGLDRGLPQVAASPSGTRV